MKIGQKYLYPIFRLLREAIDSSESFFHKRIGNMCVLGDKIVYMMEIPQPGMSGTDAENKAIGASEEFERRRREAQERIYSDRERGGSYPMEGEYYYDALRNAEVGENGDVSELVNVLERVKAYQEGLLDKSSSFLIDFDPDKPNNPQTRRALAYFRDLFLTVEGSSKRPNAPYVLIQEKQCVEMPLVQAEAYRQDQEGYRKRRQKEFRDINEARILRGEVPIGEEAINTIISKDEARLVNEYYASRLLLGIANHSEARDTIDYAFRQRMATCENPDAASKLGGEIRAVSPDSSTWESFFHTEGFSDFGEKVDMIFEEIVKFGLSKETVQRIGLTDIPENIRLKVCRKSERGVYADGFKDTTAFAHWMKYLIDKADGRLDVVWTAWRLALTWEIPEKLGVYVDFEKGKYVLAAPPVGNSLINQTSHTKEKRRHEFGINSRGERFQTEKFISHSGLPVSIDAIPNLCDDFLHQTKIKFNQDYLSLDGPFKDKLVDVLETVSKNLPTDENSNEWIESYKNNKGVKLAEDIRKFLSRDLKIGIRGKETPGKYQVESIELSLWDLRIFGGWKFSDDYFPWLISDQPPDEKAEAGEMPMGAFGFWLLTRSRSFSVLTDIKSRFSLRDIADPDFFVQRVRNWTKVLGPIKDILPEKNPRNWWLAGLLYYHYGGPVSDYKLIKENTENDIRTFLPSEIVEFRKEGMGEKAPTPKDIIKHAINAGFLRQNDVQWLNDNLRL